MTSPRSSEVPFVGFAALDARVREAVEAVAVTDPNPADPFRGLYITDEAAVEMARTGAGPAPDDHLRELAKILGLDPLDTAVLAAAAAPEISPRWGRLYGYLHDDVTRKLPSPGLIARLLYGPTLAPASVLARFGRDARLRRVGAIRLLDEGGKLPLADRGVKVADPLAARLVGAELDEHAGDARLVRRSRSAHDLGREEAVRELRALAAAPTSLPLLVVGPDADGLLAAALERPLLVVDVAHLSDAELAREARLVAALEQRQLCYVGLEAVEPGDRRSMVANLEAQEGRPLLCAPTRDAVIALGDRTALVVEVPMPEFPERRAAWAAVSGADDVDDVAAKFRLSSAQIADGAEVARQAAAADGHDVPTPRHLDQGARRASSSRLGELARRLDPVFTWRELVLAERPMSILKSISSHLRHRDLVLAEWGYAKTVARNQGIKALFAGDSGTGKTMAAQVLANDLGLEIYRIDLATVVSKYIGETEKNLDRIFTAAEGSNAILFFDEADALFGKRSEVSDSHDRYANIEVAYLLQKMEEYSGAVVLATNFRHNLDDAFLRRLDFVIDFPFPEPEDRARIWKLVLPDEAPLADDLDVAWLAERFKLSGGGIRNASLAGAFIAAEERDEIRMAHIVQGVALEYGKLGRLTLETDFEQFHALVRQGPGPDGDDQ